MEHVKFTSLSPTNEHQQVQKLARFVRALRQRHLMMQQMMSTHVLATKMHQFLVEGVFVTNGMQHEVISSL
jgi:hypothetical protein